MKKALISPNEKVFGLDTGVELGERVADTAAQDFPIAPPLFWVDCADDIVAGLFYYNPANGEILPIPMPPEPAQPVVVGAQNL